MTSKELKIEGMSCGHCIMSVRKELSKLSGVIVDEVQIGSAKVRYDEGKVTSDALKNAVVEAGYRLVAQ